MRIGILLIGLFIILFGALIAFGIGYPIEIFVIIGIINIALGAATPKSPGLGFQSDPLSPVKLIVDNGRTRGGTYELVFSNTGLVMKKLASQTAVIVFALLFAIIGGLISGVTGYSIQEFLVERKRKKIHSQNGLTTIASGDVEIPYSSMSQVELIGTRLKILSPNGPSTIAMHKKYPPAIMAKLKELIPSQAWAIASPASV